MKTKTIYVLIVVVLLVVLAIYIAKALIKDKEEERVIVKEQQETGSKVSADNLTTTAEFPLKLTSPMKRGSNVRQLQNWLNKQARKTGLFATIGVDGIFGKNTETLLNNITGKKEMSQLEFTTNQIYNESIY